MPAKKQSKVVKELKEFAPIQVKIWTRLAKYGSFALVILGITLFFFRQYFLGAMALLCGVGLYLVTQIEVKK
jgi:hypothetical protein